jgi:polysaccharide export outer membrane protein
MKKLATFSRLVLFTLAVSQLLSNCTADSELFKPVPHDPASGISGAEQAYAAQKFVPTTQQPAPASSLENAQTATTPAARTNMPVAAGQPVSASTGDSANTTTDYKISPQDILQIAVFQIKDLDSAVQVGEDGNIALPLVGKIQVKGKTTYQAEQMIAGRLREKYLQSPQVTVSIKQYGKRITVSGEVKVPKVLPDDGNTTLSQAVAGAGGLSELGDPTRIHIARSTDQRVQDEVYNLADVQAGKTRDPLLRGGDIVVAEQSGKLVALKTVKDLLPFAILASVF